MAEFDVKRLSKSELLDKLVQLSEENGVLKKENKLLNKQLEERQIHIKNLGSIAEATIAVNNVFENADKAAKQFLENARVCEEEAKARSTELMAETQKKCDEMIVEAENRVSEARVQCAAMIAAAKKNIDEQWGELKIKLEQYCEIRESLKEQLGNLNENITSGI